MIGSDVPNFVKDVPRVPKCVPRWGSAPNHFLMGSKMISCTIHVQMGDPEAIGSDVPNLIKDIPNFVKNVQRVRNCIPRWDQSTITSLWVSNLNYEPSILKWGSQKQSDRMYQI